MLWNGKNGSFLLDGVQMNYCAFGRGAKTLVLLPGLGDGLRSMKGMAIPAAVLYRKFAKAYRVLVFSRKEELPQGCTTRDMAEDVRRCLGRLGVNKACVVGVSMGGMIAQHLAADHPELVEKLVLVSTSARPNPTLEDTISDWADMARRGDHRALMVDNGNRIYSHGYLKKYGWMFPIAARFTKPRSYERFLIMAQACLTHDAYGRLDKIKAPTLVVGGEQDKTLSGAASYEMAARIPGCRIKMYEQYGHGIYDEAEDFQQLVLDFLGE